jgi:hypothetical protein
MLSTFMLTYFKMPNRCLDGGVFTLSLPMPAVIWTVEFLPFHYQCPTVIWTVEFFGLDGGVLPILKRKSRNYTEQ